MPTRSIVLRRIITIEVKEAYLTPDNTITVELTTGATAKGKLNLSPETLQACAEILANNLLDYAKNGGDMSVLTPKKIFGKKPVKKE